MIRKLILPVLVLPLLAGCMTSGYNYRQDRGDYYYGQPSTEYRYHGSPYGYYGGASYSYGRSYYPGYYGRYPYYYDYYGHPGYYRPPLVVRPRPDDGHRPPRQDNDGKAPWRDLDRLQRERVERAPMVQRRPVSIQARPATQDVPVSRAPVVVRQPRPSATPAPTPARPTSNSGSRSERVYQRARASRISREVEP